MFDVTAFGTHGKLMDSWESSRHNPLSHDTAVFRLNAPCHITALDVSTQWHYGNQAQAVRIEASEADVDALGFVGENLRWDEVPFESNTQTTTISC